jgi:site-specific DNA-methyltransferase (adenine-specific)
MNDQVSFALRGRNPDVLTCIANLSNDEVFTPPEFANRMLDTLAEGWAANNNGKDIWADSAVRFLDPCSKSGVFLREITRRLNDGLEVEIPDRQKRIDHILTKQVFGIGITQVTSLLSRRSVYCSKQADGAHSIAKTFADDAGNVWFERREHTWVEGRCKFCRVGQKTFDRGKGLETHAYALIHSDDIKSQVSEMFGGDMQFDVIIGNPPYQMKGGAGGSSDSSIYHLFVEQALKLDPRLLCMVIPSRWLAGGRGLDDFRSTMLTGKHISHLVDYTKMSTAFPGVDFEGGVGFFLWDQTHNGDCEYTLYLAEERQPPVTRDLSGYDVFVRDQRSLTILNKIRAVREPTMDSIVSSDTPFGLPTNLVGWKTKPFKDSVAVYLTDRGKRTVGYIPESSVRKNTHLIGKWKLLLPEAYGERGAIPAMVLGPSLIVPPESVCTQTYLVAGPFKDQIEAQSVQTYLSTRFSRFLVSLRKITQHALRSTYSWVPQQSWDRSWTDKELYKKYGITKDEIAFIASMIRTMGDSDE